MARRRRKVNFAGTLRPLGAAALRVVPALFVGVLFVWPVAALVRRAWQTADAGQSPLELLERTSAAELLGVTLAQAAASTVLALIVAAPIVWLFAHVRGAGALALVVVVTVPFVLPTVVVGVAFRAVLTGPLAPLGIGSGWGAVLAAHAFLNVAVMVRVVGAAWRNLDPRTEQVARTLGANPWRAFVTVTLPRLVPAIASAASLVFLFCATSFGVIIILGGGALRTLETEIYTQAIGYFRIPEAVMLSMLQIVVVVAALLLTRLFTSSSSGGSATDAASRPRVSSPAVVVAKLAASVWTVVLLVGPLVVLAIRSVRPVAGGEWTLDGYRALSRPVNGVTPLETLRYSLTTAALAMVIALLVGLLGALALHRSHGVVGSIGNLVAMIPLGISAVTLGFGYLIVLASLPTRVSTSTMVIPCVQALIAVPVVIRILLPALESVPDRLRQAAASLGAAPLRVFWTVDLPIVGRSIAAAGGFAFIMALGEFGATSFLARADTTTLPVLIGSALNRPGAEYLATAMASSMLLVAATTVIVLVVEAFRPRTGVLI